MNLALKLPLAETGVSELAAGLFWKPSEKIAMLWAYFDESGEHDQTPHRLTIGGLIAPLSDWQAFEVAWDAALQRHNRRSYHRRDFAGDDSEFVKIIAEHVPLVVGFSATPQPPREKVSEAHEAYEATLVDCLLRVAQVSQDQQIAVMFANHSEFKPQNLLRYFEIVNWNSAQLRGPYFDNPNAVSPLQAADLVAWELRTGEGEKRLRGFGCRVFRWRDGRPA
jgi:hypothetical protein